MTATVDVVIPVYNEERALPHTIQKLTGFLKTNLDNPWQIIIADNASTDNTRIVSKKLCREHRGVNYLYLPQKGRGRALRTAWLESDADIVSYMDADLSTDLAHFPQLIKALESGYHIATGSRLSKGSRVTRSFRREVISRSYNLMIKSLFFTSFEDAQCGFKALTRQTARNIVPRVENNNWFFDTELLLIAAKRGYRIKSIPVKWDDDPNSTVNVFRTALEDVKGLLRLRFGGIPQVPRADDAL
jgi:glycosyltransferase involved in cell wall biosynthesis